jgi:hypothetical protein
MGTPLPEVAGNLTKNDSPRPISNRISPQTNSNHSYQRSPTSTAVSKRNPSIQRRRQKTNAGKKPNSLDRKFNVY